jgi:hypothetical protein
LAAEDEVDTVADLAVDREDTSDTWVDRNSSTSTP